MPNTFLQTNRVVSATTNPSTNINQVSNEQPIANNNANKNSQNGIAPITIPIQLQPQITPVNNEQNQFIQSNQGQQNNNTAQTPQEYQPSQNNNVVNFNDIYKSYQNVNANNNMQNDNFNSGVKKTNLGTTIVTPINTNINTVEGQYQSAFSDTINGLIAEMLEQTKNGFAYNPNEDSALKLATEYAANSTLQNLAGSGVLNSSSTSERVARIVRELIPQYEEKAHDRWIEYLGNLADTAQLVMGYDSQQFEYWKDAKDREFQEKQFNFEKQQKELESAWKRVDELGYVDNEASSVLGVAVGTLSGAAREAKEQREFEMKKMKEQAELEYQNNKALAELKSELDRQAQEEADKREFEYQKQLAEFENQLNMQRDERQYQQEKDLYSYKAETESKYNTSSSNSNNYSEYESIIQNRYAPKDPVTGQYIASDEENYNDMIAYLDGLRASGAISISEYQQLLIKYGKNDFLSENNTSEKAGLTSNNKDIWIKALDGNNNALDTLGVTINGQKKSWVNNSDVKAAVNEALKQIENGTYNFTSNQQLMNDLKNERFGKLRWGL